jgi:flagellar biosynthesis/type III secretory pathway protein FliH
VPGETDTLFAPPASNESGASPRARARDRLPLRPIAAALVVCLLAAGIGGYLIGNSPEADLDAVRSAAAAAGREAGSEQGSEEGYAEGFKEARTRSYAPAYRAAYKEAYAREFESVGLAPPERIRVPRSAMRRARGH